MLSPSLWPLNPTTPLYTYYLGSDLWSWKPISLTLSWHGNIRSPAVSSARSLSRNLSWFSFTRHIIVPNVQATLCNFQLHISLLTTKQPGKPMMFYPPWFGKHLVSSPGLTRRRCQYEASCYISPGFDPPAKQRKTATPKATQSPPSAKPVPVKPKA